MDNINIPYASELAPKIIKGKTEQERLLNEKKSLYIDNVTNTIISKLIYASEHGYNSIDCSIEAWAYNQIAPLFIEKGYYIKIDLRYKDFDGGRYTIPDKGENYCTCYNCIFYIEKSRKFSVFTRIKNLLGKKGESPC